MPYSNLTPQELENYIPAALARSPEGTYVDWVYAGQERLGGTLHLDIAGMTRRYPDHRAIRTDLDTLRGFLGDDKSLQPDGFIFHMGRCGSTVISNAMDAVNGAIAVAEPTVLSHLLASYLPLRLYDTEEQWRTERPDLTRGCVAAYSRKRRGDERRCFIKLTDFEVLQYAFVRSLWPRTPCLFMYREPVEVMASQFSAIAPWLLLRLLPAAELGLDEARDMWLEEYCARVLGIFCSRFANEMDDRCALLNYRDINEESFRAVCAFFGCDASEIDDTALGAAMRRDAKAPDRSKAFVPDSDRKRKGTTELMREMVDRHAAGPYAELEKLRQSFDVRGRGT